MILTPILHSLRPSHLVCSIRNYQLSIVYFIDIVLRKARMNRTREHEHQIRKLVLTQMNYICLIKSFCVSSIFMISWCSRKKYLLCFHIKIIKWWSDNNCALVYSKSECALRSLRLSVGLPLQLSFEFYPIIPAINYHLHERNAWIEQTAEASISSFSWKSNVFD